MGAVLSYVVGSVRPQHAMAVEEIKRHHLTYACEVFPYYLEEEGGSG